MLQADDLIEIKDAFVYNKPAFLWGGVWPQRRNRVLFVTMLSYQILAMVLCAWAAYDERQNFQMVLLDLMEWIIQVSIILATILFWISDNLDLIIDEIKNEIKQQIFLKNDTERRLYQRYNNIAWKFSKYATAFQAAVVVLMCLRPLVHLIAQAGENNATLTYNLPFQAHIFFDYKNHTMRYFFLYLYQFPMIYFGMFHIAEVSFVVTMVLHLCGKFSILCSRIRNISTKTPHLFRENLKSVVSQHLELRKMSEILNDNFYLLLLIEYISCSSRLSLSMYVALTMFETDPVAATNFIMYSVDVNAYLYLYSYIGEQLRSESQSISDALYDIEWTDVSNEDRKLLLTCLINGCQAEYVTAGKFYTFTLFGFTKIVKFSMAFLSVLRARME